MNKENLGWIVSLWIDVFQNQMNQREDQPYLSWSPYDRVTIKVIDRFSDFFKDSSLLKWNGTVQRLHLFPTGDFNWEPGNCSLITINGIEKEYGIYCIITARYKTQFTNIDSVKEKIHENIEQHLANKDVQWQEFQSLGAEDFVGIFLANNIADLAEIADFIKQICYTDSDETNKNIFHLVYSFLGLNISDFCQEPKANLLIKLYLKAGITREETLEALNSSFCNIFKNDFPIISSRQIVSGRGFLEIEISNHANILSCFHNKKDAVFNGNSDFYKKYIENSRTYWYISSDKTWPVNSINIGTFSTTKEVSTPEKTYSLYNSHPISKFILLEYERMINSYKCLEWKPILQTQYEVYAKFAKQYFNENNETALCALNNHVQAVLLHINQATSYNYEIPYHNYYYTGSYNDVLKMYYGIIASIFKIAYHLPRENGSYQYNISYCVDFESATKVHSVMYTLNASSERFVVFHLPYDAFMHFDKTIKLLLHEVFHYIAPFSRKKRNFTFLECWIIIVFEQYLSLLEKKGLDEENSKYLTEYFYNNYNLYCDKIEEVIDEKFYDIILNDFIISHQNDRFKPVLENICQIICSDFNQNLGLYLKKVKEYSIYQNVFKELFMINGNYYLYFKESIRSIATAAKEAFCDLNMIYILNLSLEDYFIQLYQVFSGIYRGSSVSKRLEDLIAENQIKIGSFDLRIGMVISYFFKAQNKNYQTQCDLLNDIISGMLDKKPCNDELKIFCKYIDKSYSNFIFKYRKEYKIFLDFFEREGEWFQSYKEQAYNLKELRKAATNQKNIIDNINIINYFKHINPHTDKISNNKVEKIKRFTINNDIKVEEAIVCNIGEYIEKCNEFIQEWDDRVVWFRGICCKEFHLIPSLFRKIDKSLSLYENQVKYLKSAYYATVSNPSFWMDTNSTLQHLCIIQHYGMPTNLLDFTDDMLMALHFALNPDNPDDKKKIDEFYAQPRVVLFNPFRYCEAVESLNMGAYVQLSNKYSPFLLDIQNKEVEPYYVHNMSKEFMNEQNRSITGRVPNSRINLYPQPLIVKRLNDRIRAQSGTFVAYNLFSYPDSSNSLSYDYLQLERIQKEYLSLIREKISDLSLNGSMSSNKNKETIEHLKNIERQGFIKEILIDKLSIPIIKEQLKTMHITTSRAYPELFRVFQEHSELIK